MEKIALFDFCETIADFQTLDPYLELVLSREKPNKNKILCNPIAKRFCQLVTVVLHVLGSKQCLNKELMIRQLQGLTRDRLEAYGQEYYERRVKDHLIAPSLELIGQLKAEKCRVLIASAGAELYIQYFAREYGIDGIIAAEIGFDGELCTGCLLNDCVGERKAARIKEALERIGGKPFLIGVTDSRSDLPMLELCDRKIVISRGKHQSWVSKDMEEILWD